MCLKVVQRNVHGKREIPQSGYLSGFDRWYECDRIIILRRSLVGGERRINYLIILLKSFGRA